MEKRGLTTYLTVHSRVLVLSGIGITIYNAFGITAVFVKDLDMLKEIMIKEFAKSFNGERVSNEIITT